MRRNRPGRFGFSARCMLAAVAATFACGPRLSPRDPTRIALTSRLLMTDEWRVDYACRQPPPPGNMLIVNDPDAACGAGVLFRDVGVWIGYLSLGEVNERIPEFQALRRAGALLGPNPRWPGAWFVDVTKPAYQETYLASRADQIAAKGFQGLFLDTVDSALAERPDRVSAREAIAATVAAVRSLRLAHPGWIIVPNGGLAARGELAPYVDGWAVEDAFAGYDFARRAYRPTDEARQTQLLPVLRELRDLGIPIFVLDYAAPSDTRGRAVLRARCRGEGFRCAVSSIELGGTP